MLALAGVPGIYVHSLFGSRNCQTCLQERGQPRALNREKFTYPALEAQLADPHSRPARILRAYRRLLNLRRQHPAFHPQAAQEVLSLHPGVFAVRRGEGPNAVLVLASVRPTALTVAAPRQEGLPRAPWRDVLSGETVSTPTITLAPYQVRLLTAR